MPDGEATLGRDPTNLVAVADSSVSRKHCLLRREEDGRFQIKDLDSRNGTLVNGRGVKEQWLRHGDEDACSVGHGLPTPGRGDWRSALGAFGGWAAASRAKTI